MFRVLDIALPLLLARIDAVPPVKPTGGVGVDRQLVVANLYSINWSILSGTPSGEASVFLGSSLRPRRGGRGRCWKTALGYEIGGSLGGADFHTAFFSWGGDYGIAYHRHHVAALGHGGPNNRLYYHFGGGVLIWRSTPMALEADVRLGVLFGTKYNARVRGVVGGQARIVGIFGGVPLPQFGLFVGFFAF